MILPKNYATSPLRSAWRLFPARARNYLFTYGSALVAPAIARDPPLARAGLAVAGELSATTGIGEGARLMVQVLASLRVPTWEIDVGPAWQPTSKPVLARLPRLPNGVPLVVHANAPMLPASLMRLPRTVIHGRRIVGYWSWELCALPPEWAIGATFVHEIWVPSKFTAMAVERLKPGRVRVVPHPVAAAPPTPSALTRREFGLPDNTVVVLAVFNLASSLERKNPYAAIAAFRAAFGNRRDRLLVLKVGYPTHFPVRICTFGEGSRCAKYSPGSARPTAGRQSRSHRCSRHRSVASSKRGFRACTCGGNAIGQACRCDWLVRQYGVHEPGKRGASRLSVGRCA